MKNRSTKDALIARWRSAVVNAPAVVVFAHQGVHGGKTDELRAECRRRGVRYVVLKRTLARRAVADTALAGLAAQFERGTALAVFPPAWHAPLGELLGYVAREFETRLVQRDRKYYPRGSNPVPGKSEALPWRTPGPHLALRGGFLEGRLFDAAGVRAIAALPPREQLLAEIVGLIEAPARALLATLALPALALHVDTSALARRTEATMTLR